LNPAGLDVARIKRNVTENWNSEPLNWPVKVISAKRAAALGATAGKVVPVRGYVTADKFVRGRQLDQVEKILGLVPGDLKNGAVLLRLNRLPLPAEFELRGYTQTPAGLPFAGGAYPPGLGASQWELTADIAATVLKIAPAGQRL
jgi:hypothetical protein